MKSSNFIFLFSPSLIDWIKKPYRATCRPRVIAGPCLQYTVVAPAHKQERNSDGCQSAPPSNSSHTVAALSQQPQSNHLSPNKHSTVLRGYSAIFSQMKFLDLSQLRSFHLFVFISMCTQFSLPQSRVLPPLSGWLSDQNLEKQLAS